MKLMIASDLHGSAYHVNELMEALRREQRSEERRVGKECRL